MAEYIDRKALLDELCRDNCERTYDGTCHNCRMTDTIADFPASDVAEVRHGRWSTEACESVSKRNRLIKYRVLSIEYIYALCVAEAMDALRKGIAPTAEPAWT